MVKDREILTRVQQLHVSILINLKGPFCYQRGIESIRQPMWKGCLSHKNTLYAHKGQERLMTIQMSEWVFLRPSNS